MTFASALLALSPRGLYLFDDTSGTTMTDSSGNGHGGTYDAGATLGVASGVGSGTAVSSDGSTGIGVIPNGTWMDVTSFSYLVAMTPSELSNKTLVHRQFMAEIDLLSSGQVYGSTRGNSGGVEAQGGTAVTTAPGLYVMTYDEADDFMRVWVNGTQVASVACPSPLQMFGTDITVGSFLGSNAQPGVYEAFGLFDYALSGAQQTAIFAEMAGTPPPDPPPVFTSDLTFGGYGYGGASVATWMPPVDTAAPPGTFPAATIHRVHHNPGTVTLEAGTGRPLFAGYGTEAIDPWCDFIRVTVDGRDVTWFRGIPTKVVSWQHLDPYGDGPAELSFPQVTEFDNPGTGDLAWLRPTARVVLNRVVDGAVVDASDPLWVGVITRDGLESGPLSVTCEGAYMGRQSRLLHQPYFLHNPARTLKDHLIREHRKIYRADFQIVGSVTGPLLRQRGARSDTRLTYVDSLLGLSNREDGGSYTLLPDRSVARNAMRLQLRTMGTPDYTVWAGAHGVKVSLAREVSTNRVYGEGVNKDGGRWGNRVFPNAGYDDDPPDYPFSGDVSVGETGTGVRILTRRLWSLGLLESDDAGSDTFDDEVAEAVDEFRKNLGLPQTGTMTETLWPKLYRQGFNQQSFQGAHFEPLAAATETVQWLRGPGGLVTEPNPDYVRAVQPVEEFQADGENVSKREGKKYARATIARQPVRVGTMTLTSDPEECSRFEMRAGKVVDAKNLLGSGATGIPLYISSVEIDWSGGSVTLGVSTSALHFVELQTIRQRQVEARQNPSKRARQALRSSGVTKDVVQGWESEGPSGVIPYRLAQSGQWVPFQVVAAEYGSLAELRIVADSPTPLMAMIFGKKVPAGLLNHVIGNPFVWRNVLAGRSLTDVVTTDGDATITSASGAFDDSDIGRTISGAGIPSGATITGRNSSTSVDISPVPSATATGVNVDIGPNDDNRKNTFDVHAEFLRKHLIVQAYGTPEEPGGYHPHRHTNDKGKITDWPATGVLHDDAGQQFATTGGFLWVYVWVMSDSRVHGRAKLIPES